MMMSGATEPFAGLLVIKTDERAEVLIRVQESACSQETIENLCIFEELERGLDS